MTEQTDELLSGVSLLEMAASLVIRNAHLAYAGADASTLFDVICEGSKVVSITNSQDGSFQNLAEEIDCQGTALLLPALCHAHIHLDKCYLLDRCALITGDFAEALKVTSSAKADFTVRDVYERGKRLIIESVAVGVTSMRAHVEIDATVEAKCFEAGRDLKHNLKHLCDIQLCAFAQDPFFTANTPLDAPGPNYRIWAKAVGDGVTDLSAVGSAPYVEPSQEHAHRNIQLVFDLAHAHGLHADFHLDYNLDATSEPLIWTVLKELRNRIRAGQWREESRVCIGHATRLTLFSDDEWKRYKDIVYDGTCPLPVTLVGLPQSDTYMMGRGAKPAAPRGTLDVCALRKREIDVAMAVNNVGNAFTPQGAPDPLSLCPLGVALFQDATDEGCRALLDAVTASAKRAIGQKSTSLVPCVGDEADFVLLHENVNVQSAVCAPSYSRTTIKSGQVVARRTGAHWLTGQNWTG